MAYTCCLMIASSANAQDELAKALDKDSKRDTKAYTIQSLEGKRCMVHIMPNYNGRILKIGCLKDTITLDGPPADVSYLGKKFLQIKYEVRGGSNLALGNTLILCLSNNKLYEALHVLRYSDWESDLVKKYNVDFSLHTFRNNYVLTGAIKEKVISEEQPETNYNFKNRKYLQFDKKLKVFYSIKSDLYDTLEVCYSNITYKREIDGNFPKVLLGREEYLFNGNQWFELYNNSLTKY
jgi:hypothetical protein